MAHDTSIIFTIVFAAHASKVCLAHINLSNRSNLCGPRRELEAALILASFHRYPYHLPIMAGYVT